MRKVLLIDTSLFCVWLRVPKMEVCTSKDDKWDYDRVNQKIQEEIKDSTSLVLPLATVVETGNHIAQAKSGNKYEIAEAFAKIMIDAADETSPWVGFFEQTSLWEGEELKKLANEFPNKALQEISMGDSSIVTLGWYYYKIKGYHVEFLTADKGLKSQEPPPPTLPTRRSSRR